MGIKNLNNIIRNHTENGIQEKYIKEYHNKKIAIDASILIYKSIYHYQRYHDFPHIIGVINKCMFFIKHNMIPVFVFDGIPPPEKNNTLIKRSKYKNNIKKKIEELKKTGTEEQIKNLEKQYIHVTREQHQEVKLCLDKLGIPTILANGEAETTCALLTKLNKVDYTFTEDTDALTFGTPKVIRFSKKKDHFYELDLNIILTELEMNMSQFIDFCILCGCDYSPTIKNIGPKTSFHFIQRYQNIENILNYIKNIKKYNVPDNFNYLKARELFTAQPELDTYQLDIKPVSSDIIPFLKSKKIEQNNIEYYLNILN